MLNSVSDGINSSTTIAIWGLFRCDINPSIKMVPPVENIHPKSACDGLMHLPILREIVKDSKVSRDLANPKSNDIIVDVLKKEFVFKMASCLPAKGENHKK